MDATERVFNILGATALATEVRGLPILIDYFSRVRTHFSLFPTSNARKKEGIQGLLIILHILRGLFEELKNGVPIGEEELLPELHR